MRRRLGQRRRARKNTAEINIAPLMDMVFILLIFFVVTTVFVDETGVEVQRPSAASAESLEKQSILLALTKEGRIFYAGETHPLNGVRAIVARELGERDMPVVILVDQAARSGLLVDLIDECRLAGAKNVSVAAKRDE